MAVLPHLLFHGDCQDAIETYVAAFDANIETLRYWDEDPSAGKVAQAELSFAGGTLRMSDARTSSPPSPHRGSSLTVEAPEAVVWQAFGVLSERGTVRSAVRPTATSPAHGSLIDRFGTTWELLATTTALPSAR